MFPMIVGEVGLNIPHQLFETKLRKGATDLMRDGTMMADSPCEQLQQMLNVHLCCGCFCWGVGWGSRAWMDRAGKFWGKRCCGVCKRLTKLICVSWRGFALGSEVTYSSQTALSAVFFLLEMKYVFLVVLLAWQVLLRIELL